MLSTILSANGFKKMYILSPIRVTIKVMQWIEELVNVELVLAVDTVHCYCPC